MMKTASQSRVADRGLKRVTRIALALPETTRLVHGSHAQFLVRKKTFAYFLDNHHGDGIVAFACKVLPDDNRRLVEAWPDRFYLPAYIASRGWVAIRLDRKSIDWGESGATVEQLCVDRTQEVGVRHRQRCGTHCSARGGQRRERGKPRLSRIPIPSCGICA